MSKIICLGIIVADLQIRPVDTYPKMGSLMMADQMKWSTGGCALNTSLALRKLGNEVTLIGKVGNDFLGQWITEECHHCHIDCSVLSKTNDLTSTSVVFISSSGERSFLHYPGANRLLTIEDINFMVFKDYGFVYIGGVYGLAGLDGNLERLMLNIKRANPKIKIIMDVIYHPDIQDSSMIDPALPYVDFFTPNLNEAQKLSGEKDTLNIGKYFIDKGVSTLVVTLGENGSFLYQKEKYQFSKPFRVQAIDATGAGDAFVAGFISSLSKGYSLIESIEFGNAVGAISVTKMGASEGVVSFEKTLEFISNEKWVRGGGGINAG